MSIEEEEIKIGSIDIYKYAHAHGDIGNTSPTKCKN